MAETTTELAALVRPAALETLARATRIREAANGLARVWQHADAEVFDGFKGVEEVLIDIVAHMEQAAGLCVAATALIDTSKEAVRTRIDEGRL